MMPTGAHGILAHYFHDGHRYPAMQGSLSLEAWEAGLERYGARLIPASEWIDRAVAGQTKDECCVTFDDGLREAYVIAKPSLERRGLTAAWNIYTGPLVGVPNNLERWRWLRNCKGGVEEFYLAWLKIIRPPRLPDDYLLDRTYLSYADRQFRYWRNTCEPLFYESVMEELWQQGRGTWTSEQHWLSFLDIQALARTGHVIGFHTHSHPTNMARLSVEQQALEYATSKGILEFCLEQPVNTGAHPCDSWTPEGIAWLQAHSRLMWGGTIHGAAPWHAPRWSTGEWKL